MYFQALYKLSTSMGINVTDDLTQSEDTKNDIQVRLGLLEMLCYNEILYVCMYVYNHC